MSNELKYAYTITARYRCEMCGDVHDDERVALECCAPGVTEVYVCLVCDKRHYTLESALECCDIDPAGEGVIEFHLLPKRVLEQAGQVRLFP
jgi:hypothetical protein